MLSGDDQSPREQKRESRRCRQRIPSGSREPRLPSLISLLKLVGEAFQG